MRVMRLSLENITEARSETSAWWIFNSDSPLQSAELNDARFTTGRDQLLAVLWQRYRLAAQASDLVLSFTFNEARQGTRYELRWAPSTLDTVGYTVDGPNTDTSFAVADAEAVQQLPDAAYKLSGWDDALNCWLFAQYKGAYVSAQVSP